MKDKTLTDNEIIKALECCTTNGANCKDCPAFVKVDRSNCKQVLLGAIEIINRQKAENERLKELIDVRHKVFETKCEELEIAKSEAHKEFAKFLIDKSQNSTISISDLPDYVAEMEGGASEVED